MSTDDLEKFKRLAYKTDIGQKAHVERDDHENKELVRHVNLILVKIGEDLTPRRGLEYLGSAAVHIYRAPLIEQVMFATQVTTLMNTPELIASTAFQDLERQMMAHYGRKPKRLRSGF